MKKFSLLIAFLILSIIVNSCGDRVRITEFSPQGEVNQLQTFTITFNNELAPPDKQHIWLEDEFIKFEPAIPGKFKWTSSNTLIFSPDQLLDPIQSYVANATKDVLFDKEYSVSGSQFEFHTPDFKVEKADFFWTYIPNEYYQAKVNTNILFNYPVVPDLLKENLEIHLNGEKLANFTIITKTRAEQISVDLGTVAQTDKEQNYKIVIKKGFESVYGKKGLDRDFVYEYSLPPITELEITGYATGYDGNSGWIEFATTQRVDEKKLAQFLEIEPNNNIEFFIYDNKFRIEGNFEEAQAVKVKIKKGLPGVFGGTLKNEYEITAYLINLDPSISFADRQGRYLMVDGMRNIEVRAVNTDEVEIEVFQIFKNNIVHFLNSNSYSYYSNDEDYYWGYFFVGNFGKPLYSEKKKLNSERNWLNSFTVNMNSLVPQRFSGIYLLSVSHSEDRWLGESKVFSLTDIGLIAKMSNDELIVFANSISTALPMPNVEVSIISDNNQTLATATTDGNGVARIKELKSKVQDFNPVVLIAERGDDFNYLDLRESQLETSRYDVGGVDELNEDFRVFVYSDRNLYRPGDICYLSAVVRDATINIPKELPIFIKIIDPVGRTIDEFRQSLNQQASFELAYKIQDFALTGEYSVEIHSGADNLIGNYKFSVEDFLPDKIRVLSKIERINYKPGELINLNIDAEFLFGAKAASMKYEVEFLVRNKNFSSKKYPDHNFKADLVDSYYLPNNTIDGVLSSEGGAVAQYQLPASIQAKGFLEGFAFIRVFDYTGRAVNSIEKFNVYTKNYFLGIKTSGYYYGTNSQVKFNVAGVDSEDNDLRNFKGKAQLVRYEWQSVIKKGYSNNFFYASEEREIIEQEIDFNLNGKSVDLSFVPTNSGKYEIRIFKYGESEYQKSSFYAYSWGTSSISSFKVDREGRIDIITDKESYKPGDKAKILFTAPFSGKMLVTIERNKVKDYRYIELNERSAELILPITEDYLPNIYVTATLFRPHRLEQSSPFFVGHGIASLKVEKPEYKLPITITAPEKVKPNTKQNITIKAGSERDVFVTLAAVDEGILQLKNYQTPDPYSYMYAKRSLSILSYDLYKLLLPEIISRSSLTGGDGDLLEYQLQMRTNPIQAKRYKPLAFWSGILRTNSSGTVTVPLDIPQFNGEVRLMVVAYSGKRFGSASQAMKVSDDLIIESGIPRFLAPNDKLTMPVTLINTTAQTMSVKVRVKLDGPLSLVSKSEMSISVPANSTNTTEFELEAASKAGVASIIVETTGQANVSETIELPVRYPAPFTVESQVGTLTGANEISLRTNNTFAEGTKEVNLVISRFPSVKFGEQLKNLLGYPYGCIEQTVAKSFPQLYFAEMSQMISPDLFKNNNAIANIKTGIKKVQSQQLYDGSIAYWSGGTTANWWGTVFSAHFLLEAQKAGFEVSENALNRLISYISKRAKKSSTYDYVTFTNGQRIVTQKANKEILYSLYVLASAGKADMALMNYYKARPRLLTNDTRMLLAGAYALAGRWNGYYELVPNTFVPEVPERRTGDNFDSEIRANAMVLNILLETDPTNSQIPIILKYLSDNHKKIYSTQDACFAFLAIGKAAKRQAEANLKVEVWSNGKQIGAFSEKDLVLDNKLLSAGNIKLKATGSGEAYYFYSEKGVSTRKVENKDNLLQVRRQFFDYRTRQEITNEQFHQGQIVMCKITLLASSLSAENIAIANLIPAGFEIENPRISEFANIAWKSSNPLNIDYLDIRDDRLLLFTNAQAGKSKEYYLMLRAVNRGEFALPAISADAMYSPEFNSVWGESKISIRK